jgi:uncharacterized protein YbaR (Trm112 family)
VPSFCFADIALRLSCRRVSTAVICPGCRTLENGRLDLRTLDAVSADELACECGRRYPIVDGIPIVLRDPTSYLRDENANVVERELPEVATPHVEGPDDTPYPRLFEHLSTYLDAHWGDRVDPAPDGPGAGFALAAIIDKLALLPRVAAAVELGCNAGRIVGELAQRADHVVGLDLHLGAIRRARHLLAGERLAYGRRTIGRHYTTATITPGDRAAANITLFLGDALDPPLVPRSYDRVVALNLIDSVASPRQLLSVADGLCDTGGELVLASPYSWHSSIVVENERFGGSDPAAALRAILVGGTDLTARYRIADEAQLPWTLRRDARSAVSYQVDYVRAVKL